MAKKRAFLYGKHKNLPNRYGLIMLCKIENCDRQNRVYLYIDWHGKTPALFIDYDFLLRASNRVSGAGKTLGSRADDGLMNASSSCNRRNRVTAVGAARGNGATAEAQRNPPFSIGDMS